MQKFVGSLLLKNPLNRNLLATITKLLGSAYVLSEIKADKKGDAFKVKVMQGQVSIRK